MFQAMGIWQQLARSDRLSWVHWERPSGFNRRSASVAGPSVFVATGGTHEGLKDRQGTERSRDGYQGGSPSNYQ
ncbi:hypothetical protein V6N12_063331 [Hibiscus sabdariffa]|uniref:Uncharacterized protein n=1 Tax=Hibiscus sabdariffa TaxID=183260 RepID=A0ABR2FBG3_9ROSI